jgi:hypothetical protein
VLPWLANWWDAVALWLSDLAFPFQFALVIVVLAPLCLLVAWAIDRVVDLVSARFTRSTDSEPVRVVAVPKPTVMHVRADVPAGTPATIITTVLAEQRHEPEQRYEHEQRHESTSAVRS